MSELLARSLFRFCCDGLLTARKPIQERSFVNPIVSQFIAEKKKLFAGLGSVRIVKNCDLGLENAARGLRPRAAFQDLGHSFSLYGPPSRQITYLFFSKRAR